MSFPDRYPGAVWRPISRNYTPGGIVAPTRGLIPHVQEGAGSLFGWFNSSASQVSAHLWVSRKGVVEQYVSLGDRAWAQAAGNRYWISCECEGFAHEDYTREQVQRLAEIYRWGMQALGWPPQITDSPAGYGLGAHRMGGAAWGGHSCPGDIRANRRPDILAAARGYPSTPPPSEEDDMPTADEVATAVLARLRAEMWAKPTGAPESWHPPYQDSPGAVLRRDYEMTGETLAAIDRVEDRLSAIEQELSRIGEHLGETGPIVAWTAQIGQQLTAVRAELARITAGGGAVADVGPVLAAIDRLAAQLGQLTLTVTTPGGQTL